jgi:hypothetical protein
MRTHAQSDFTRLLEDYCRSTGMGDFEIEPEGGVFDIGDVTIVVRHDDDFERVSMVAPVGDVEADALTQVAPQLLQLNAGLALSGGQAFCADMESGEVSLQQSLRLKNLSPEDLDACISLLAEKARAARDLLGTLKDTLAQGLEATEEAGKAHDPSMVLLRL